MMPSDSHAIGKRSRYDQRRSALCPVEMTSLTLILHNNIVGVSLQYDVRI